ncbi:MAG: flap endonuclease-1 [Candidatus Aenigmarchaeota archaeon]|nr:flap endonuclease-1 [Candidatus Aenigmarchaeota archaeon]
MGIQIAKILPKTEIELSDLSNKRIAIDAFNWMYQFLSIIRDRDTGEPLKDSKGRVTSHLSGLFYRTAKLLEAGIKPVYVFDGKPPEMKFAEIKVRRERRAEAAEIMKEARKAGDTETVRKYAQQSSRLNQDLIESAKELLKYMGVAVVQAPSEGEAQCAYFCKNKDVYAVASQDSDSLMFGTPKLIRNLSITGKRKVPRKDSYYEVRPEIIELKEVLKELGVNQEQLITMGILVGTDFNPGIKGIGPKKSLSLVKKEKTFDKVLEKVEWNTETPAKQIYDFFTDPPVDKKIKIKFGILEPDKIKKLLVDDFEFSETRIMKVLDNLKKTQPSKGSLGSWIK